MFQDYLQKGDSNKMTSCLSSRRVECLSEVTYLDLYSRCHGNDLLLYREMQPLSRPTQDASRLNIGLCTLQYSGSNCRIEVGFKTRVTSTDDGGRATSHKLYEDFTAFICCESLKCYLYIF